MAEAESIRLSFAPSRLRSEVRSRFEPSFCRYGFHNIILTPPANVPRTGPPKPHFQLGCPLVSLRSKTKRKIDLLVSRNEAKRKRKGSETVSVSRKKIRSKKVGHPTPNVPRTGPPKPHFSPYVPNRFTEPNRKSRFQPTFCPKPHFRSELSKILWIRPLA